MAEISVCSSVTNFTGSAPVWSTIARSFASLIDPMPVICAPFEPVMPFGFSLKSIVGVDLISPSRTIAKRWNAWSSEIPCVFATRRPRRASSPVMSANLSEPAFVNERSVIGSRVCGSKSARVPEGLRSFPVISGIGSSLSSG